MARQGEAERLARLWIAKWSEGKPGEIPLAEGFRHVSPFGDVSGRDTYLDWVTPMAEASVTKLEIVRTLGGDGEAVVWYEMTSGGTTTPCCDWVRVKDGEIVSVTAFYDATKLR